MTSAVQYIQKGETLDYTNNSQADIEYLEIVTINGVTDKFFIAAEKIAVKATGGLFTPGKVFELPAVNNAAFALGDRLFYDSTACKITKVSTGNIYAGYAAADKAATDITAYVRTGVQQLESDSAAVALIGDLDDLTTVKTNLVNAINEVDAKVATNQAASTATELAGLVADFNTLIGKLKTAGLMVADA